MFNEGVSLLASGQPEAALDEFTKSLDAAKDDQKADSLYNIAVCHARLGNLEEAALAATEALLIDPSLAQEMEADEDLARLTRSESLRPILKVATRRAALVGIRGWLLLPAIGLLMGVTVGGLGLLGMLRAYSGVAATQYAGLFLLELFAQAALVAYAAYATVRFFGKKRDAPSAIIGLLVANLTASALLLVLELNAGATLLAIENGRALVQGGIAAAIWIPYFRVSERVKATFRSESNSPSRTGVTSETRLKEVWRCGLCNVAIMENHDARWCTKCGRPLPDKILKVISAGRADVEDHAVDSNT